MILHALTIVLNEFHRHLAETYAVSDPASVALGNLSERADSKGGAGVGRNVLVMSMVTIGAEKTRRNLPVEVSHDLMARHEKSPAFLSLLFLTAATHTVYADALLSLSRAVRFFHTHPVFTHDSVSPASIMNNAPGNALDRLDEFRLLFDLYSPSMEEVHHLWGTLGGRQYPFALYNLRIQVADG